MNIGDTIKTYRKQNKITQTELANRLNKSLRTVQKYESNETVPSIKVLEDIAKILGTTLKSFTSDQITRDIVNDYVSNMSNDELITYENRNKFKHEIDNQIPIHNKLPARELELVYMAELKATNSIVKGKDDMIKKQEIFISNLSKMNDKLFTLLGLNGDTDGK